MRLHALQVLSAHMVLFNFFITLRVMQQCYIHKARVRRYLTIVLWKTPSFECDVVNGVCFLFFMMEIVRSNRKRLRWAVFCCFINLLINLIERGAVFS